MTPLCTNGRGALAVRTRSAGVRGGFALLITVTLLALVVVVLLSLVTLVRVESAVAANTSQVAQARQHALMALDLAVARLQCFAGVDQRVTARAELLTNGNGNSYWTGVWDSTSASPVPLTWLVSGGEIQPLAVDPAAAPVADPAADNDSIWLLHAPVSSPGQRIKLERRPIRATDLPGLSGPQTIGHYAWWVGDEGVKAKFNLVSPYAGAAVGTPENRLQFMSAQQFGIETIAPGFAAYAAAKDSTAAGATLRDRIGRVLTTNQIPYADSSFGLATVRDRFHDFTTYAMGVLADAHNGGLRKDLTRGLAPGVLQPAGELFPGGPAWDLLRSYYQLRPESTNGRWQVAPRAHLPPQHGVHPVVLLVQIVWGGDRVDGKFRLLFQPLIVLANPYSVALTAADYRLVWRQTGTIALVNPPGEAGAPSVGGAPEQLLGEDPRFVISQAGFLPGEAKVFTLPAAGGPWPYVAGTGVALAEGYSATGCVYRDLDTAAHATATELSVRVSGGINGFELSLLAGGPLQEISGSAANGSECTGNAPLLGSPVQAGLRMASDSMNAPGDLTGFRWLADFNLRAPVSGSLPAWGRNPQYNAATPAGGDDNTVLNDRFAFWGPGNRAEDGGQRFVTLFHLPGGDLHSLAQLQHANLQPDAAGPGYSVGQSYANPHTPDGAADFNYRLNETLWDPYFFSTVPAGSGELPAVLPNNRLVSHQPGGIPPDPDAVRSFGAAAAHLLIDGPFNVNSTSVEAWQALLASFNGQLLAWEDPATGAMNTAAVGNAFLRGTFVNGSEGDSWRGYRSLTDAQLHDVAAAIVSRVRARGPIRSLAEFVNRSLNSPADDARLSGLLQAALDQVANPPPALAPVGELPADAGPIPSLPWPAASQGHRSTLAPGWLSQADVLSAIGSVLTVRSDTFLVRAYGDAVNPMTGATESRAWCEAVVQRFPEYVDPTDAAETSTGLSDTNRAYGRRLEIIRFRWLLPDDV